MIETVLLLGLAVFGAVEMVKLFLPFSILSQVKGLLVLAFAVLGAVVFGSGLREGVLYFGAVVGLAVLIHAAHKALDGVGEINRLQAMLQIARKFRT